MTAPRTDVDCLVVGGGPVGLLTAVLLGRAGLQVAVVERWPQRYPLPRACTIDHEALRILQAAGVMAEHADLFEPSVGERGGYQFRNGDGELLMAIDWNRTAESGWANTNGFYQPDLETVLENIAQATPGVTVHRGWTFTTTEHGATVLSPTDGTGDQVTTCSRWLVGADGANSAVRAHLGIEVVDSGFEADWLVVDYRPLVEQTWDAFVVQYCDPRQPATAVNSGPGRRRFEFMRRDDVTPEQLGQESTAWALMAPWGVTPANAQLERHAVYTFRGRWARTWKVGSAFLVGDAAHLMPPFMGQGLCAGLRDARALAWRLKLVHRGLAADTVLDSYSPERGGHVREIIDEAVAAGRIICELDPARAGARDSEMRRALTEPDAAKEPPHPRLGHPSITVAGQEAAGRLAPQGRIRAEGVTGLFDDVIGGEWQLISRVVVPALDSRTTAWFASIGGTVTQVRPTGPVTDLDGTYDSWFTAHDCDVFLSRPDFYVFGTGSATDTAGLLHQLRIALQPVGGRAMSPAIDPVLFRETLGHYPTGVAVVTAVADDGEPAGMVVGTFSSVSLDPPLVAFYPTAGSFSFNRVRSAAAFCINVLAADQEPLCRQLATGGTDKFAGVHWRPGPLGAPVLAGAVSWVECTFEDVRPAGDHLVVLGRVRSLAVERSTLPLLFFQGGYGRFAPGSFIAAPDPELIAAAALAQTLRPAVEALSAELEVNCGVVARIGWDAVQVLAANRSAVVEPFPLGHRQPLIPPFGAIFLSHAPASEVADWLGRGPETGLGHIHLQRVRDRGYSLLLADPETHRRHVQALAVFEASDRLPRHERLVRAATAELADLFCPDLHPGRLHDLANIVVPVPTSPGDPSLALRLTGLPPAASTTQIDAWIERLTQVAATAGLTPPTTKEH